MPYLSEFRDGLEKETIQKELAMREWARHELPHTTILPYQSAPRNLLLASIKETLEELKDFGSSNPTQLKNLKESRRKSEVELEDKLIRQRAVVAPIRAVPPEVLLLILSKYLNQSNAIFSGNNQTLRFSSRLAPLVVCRTWRKLALSSNKCWNTLRISFDFGHGCLEELVRWSVDDVMDHLVPMIEHQISFARGRLINIVVSSPKPPPSVYVYNLFLIKNSQKISDVIVSYWGTMRSYTEIDFYICERSHISPQKQPTHVKLSDHCCMLNFDQVEKLELCGIVIVIAIKLNCPNLIHLHIRYFGGSIHELTSMLGNMPLLQSLCIPYINQHGHQISDNDYFKFGSSVFPNMRQLVLLALFDHRKFGPIEIILPLFPNLMTLGIRLESKSDGLKFGDDHAHPASFEAAKAIKTISLLTSGFEGKWENMHELMHFSGATRIEIRPDMESNKIPWDSLSELFGRLIESRSRMISSSSTYFPALKHLDFSDACIRVENFREILELFELFNVHVEHQDSSPGPGLNQLHLTVRDCEICRDDQSLRIELPDVRELHMREAAEYLINQLARLEALTI